ncbi:hypothetical protein STEG23_028455, partial [Scotinomys teguina]
TGELSKAASLDIAVNLPMEHLPSWTSVHLANVINLQSPSIRRKLTVQFHVALFISASTGVFEGCTVEFVLLFFWKSLVFLSLSKLLASVPSRQRVHS